MAMRPHLVDAQRRLQRQQAYESVTTLSALWPELAEVAIKLHFTAAAGASPPMPYRQIFLPDMQAYFEFLCPNRSCSDGGFDLQREIERARNRRATESSGVLECHGQQRVVGGSEPCCPVRLNFAIELRYADARN